MRRGPAYRTLEEAVHASGDGWVRADVWLAAHEEDQARRYGHLGRDAWALLREEANRLRHPLSGLEE